MDLRQQAELQASRLTDIPRESPLQGPRNGAVLLRCFRTNICMNQPARYLPKVLCRRHYPEQAARVPAVLQRRINIAHHRRKARSSNVLGWRAEFLRSRLRLIACCTRASRPGATLQDAGCCMPGWQPVPSYMLRLYATPPHHHLSLFVQCQLAHITIA